MRDRISQSTASCSQPSGFVADSTDCNVTTAAANPNAQEYCDTIDNNCDGVTDEDSAVDASSWFLDSDGDGYGDSNVPTLSCAQPENYTSDASDCDDSTASTNPAAIESCDAIDNNCEGGVSQHGHPARSCLWGIEKD